MLKCISPILLVVTIWLHFANILQEELVRAGVQLADYDFDAHKKMVPMLPVDVPTTYTDASVLERNFGFTPKITLREGLRKFQLGVEHGY